MKYKRLLLITFIALMCNVAKHLQLDSSIKISGSAALAQTSNESVVEANKLYEKARELYINGQLQEALQLWEQALAVYRNIGNAQGEGGALYSLGDIYNALGNNEKSIAYLEQALNVYQMLEDRHMEASSLLALGHVYWFMGEYDKTSTLGKQSLAIAEEIRDINIKVSALNILGNVYRAQGEIEKAIGKYESSLLLVEQMGDESYKRAIFNNLGLSYHILGDYKKAFDYHQQSLVIAEKSTNKIDKMAALGFLGLYYFSVGDYSTAIHYHEQSIAIAQKSGIVSAESESLMAIGNIYFNIGDYDRAIDYYQKSLLITKEAGQYSLEGGSLISIGQVYTALDENEKAIDYYKQALSIAREIGNRSQECSSLSLLSYIYYKLDDYDTAIDYQQESLLIAEEKGYSHQEARALNILGNIYLAQGKYEQAIKYLEESLVIAKNIGDIAQEGIILHDLGLALLQTGNIVESEKILRRGIDSHENIRKLLGFNDTWKVSIFEIQALTYQQLQEVLVAQNQPQKALEISEKGRARALVELSLRKLSPQLKEEFTPKSPNLTEIKAIAKEQNATLVEYSLISEFNQLYIWVIPPNGEIKFRSVKFPKDFPLKELVQASRQSLGATSSGENDATFSNTGNTNYQREFHKLLIEPIAEFLPQNETERIIFIPDQELFLIPFAALQDANYTYLIEKHTILTAPSIQSLSLTRQHQKRVQNSSEEILIVGNPKMPQNQEGKTLPNLDWAQKEAEAVAEILGSNPLLGSQATEPAILEKMANAKIIHLATHGILGEVDSSPGAIALTPAGEDDGYLTTREIMESFGLAATPPLQAELVVLSACDTGSGDIKGEGVIGLSRSLIAAGVPTIVVSLWQVPDDDTNLLMTEFYTNLYEKKLDKAQAMRQAMLTMLNEDRGNFNPIAWAAFTVIGEAE